MNPSVISLKHYLEVLEARALLGDPEAKADLDRWQQLLSTGQAQRWLPTTRRVS